MIAKEDDTELRASMRVELAINDAGLRDRVRIMLADQPGITVVDADEHAADVRISDGAVETADGIPVVLLSDGSNADEARAARAAAILSACIDAPTLAVAICAAAQGLTVLSPEVRHLMAVGPETTELESAEDEPLAVDLTPREVEVLHLLAEGASNKAIARRLGVTPHTAKFHVASIIAKLGANGRTDAVAKAMRFGLVMI